MVSSQARREQVAFACERGLSKRRACELLKVARSALSYRSVRGERDGPVIEAMKRLAAQYPRYGYRRIRIFLRREGYVMSRHRAHRLWRIAGLQLPRRRPRRRAAHSRPRPLPAAGANQVWAYDFVFDACANRQSLKCLTVIDEFTRECLAIDVAGSIRSARVIDVLTRLISQRGAPRYLRSDNGPEFVSKAILEWLERIEAELDRFASGFVEVRHKKSGEITITFELGRQRQRSSTEEVRSCARRFCRALTDARDQLQSAKRKLEAH